MPLPPYLISVSAFICERILYESDRVLSAIRIVDVFYVQAPTDAPEGLMALVQAHCLVLFKTRPEYQGQHSIEFKMLNTQGESSSLGEAIKTDFSATMEHGVDVPGGANARIELNIAVKRYGTCYLCVHLDGEEITRVPFTLRQKPAEKNG